MSKVNYIGAPAIFALEMACWTINEAFDCYGCYLVGSSLERQDWRDVDIRMIMSDEAFAAQFPDAGQHWEHNPKWVLLTCAIAAWLRQQTGLPIDFQIQPQSHANERHKGQRHAIGLKIRQKAAPAATEPASKARCNVVHIPKVGQVPLKDAQCKLEYGHAGKHEFDPTPLDETATEKEGGSATQEEA